MSKFSSFLKKHSAELSSVASVLGMVVRALPIDPGDKRSVERALDSLHESAANIKKAATDLAKNGDAKVTKTELKNALSEMVPDLLGELVEAGIKKALENNKGS